MPLLPGVSCLDLSPKTGHPSTCDNQMPAAVLPACCSAALLIAMTLGLIGRDMFGNVDSEFGSSTIQGDTSNALRGWLRSFILQYHEDMRSGRDGSQTSLARKGGSLEQSGQGCHRMPQANVQLNVPTVRHPFLKVQGQHESLPNKSCGWRDWK